MSSVPTDVARAEGIRASLPEGGLFHEKSWRISPRGFAITPEQETDLEKLGYRLRLFQRACNLLYRLSVKGKQPAWIAELLDAGKPDWLIRVARERAFIDEVPRVIRPDLILTEEGYAVSELDSVPGGIGLTAWLAQVYADQGEAILGGPDGMLDGFSRILPGGDIIVSEEAATYRPEMEWLAGRLNDRGSGKEWRVLDERADHDWQERVYRFFELFDLDHVPAARSLVESAAAGKRQITPPYKPWMEEKLLAALLWLRPLRDFWRLEIGERHFLKLLEVMPFSWLVNPEPLPPHAVLPRLEVHSWEEVAAFSQKERDLVLKISGFHETAWGARGVTIGSDVPQHEWRAALEGALAGWPNEPYMLQVFHHPRVVEQPVLNEETGEVEVMKGKVRLCPYYFLDGKETILGGALATICPPDKKLLHGMTDAILTPAVVESRDSGRVQDTLG